MPLTNSQLDTITRTVYGEAANQGPAGWAAVASVIDNRSNDGRWSSDPAAVATQPGQFSTWNTGAGGNSLARNVSPDNPTYQQIYQTVQGVFDGSVPDPTAGAVYYYAPAGMPGGTAPRWWNSATAEGAPRQIGDQIFAGQVGGNIATEGTTRTAAAATLANLGYTGPDAVRQFQADAGISVDGIVGPQTMAAIAQSVQNSPPAPIGSIGAGVGAPAYENAPPNYVQQFATSPEASQGTGALASWNNSPFGMQAVAQSSYTPDWSTGFPAMPGLSSAAPSVADFNSRFNSDMSGRSDPNLTGTLMPDFNQRFDIGANATPVPALQSALDTKIGAIGSGVGTPAYENQSYTPPSLQGLTNTSTGFGSIGKIGSGVSAPAYEGQSYTPSSSSNAGINQEFSNPSIWGSPSSSGSIGKIGSGASYDPLSSISSGSNDSSLGNGGSIAAVSASPTYYDPLGSIQAPSSSPTTYKTVYDAVTTPAGVQAEFSDPSIWGTPAPVNASGSPDDRQAASDQAAGAADMVASNNAARAVAAKPRITMVARRVAVPGLQALGSAVAAARPPTLNGNTFIGAGNGAISSIRGGQAPPNSYATAINNAPGYSTSWNNSGPGGSAQQYTVTPSGNNYTTYQMAGQTFVNYGTTGGQTNSFNPSSSGSLY